MTVTELISLWPRAIDLARELDVSPSRISDWKTRNAIPVGYWRAILDSASRRRIRGVTADVLVRIHDSDPGVAAGGFGESDAAVKNAPTEAQADEPEETGHFSRHKRHRRAHFRTGEEIEDHIRALREEWTHR